MFSAQEARRVDSLAEQLLRLFYGCFFWWSRLTEEEEAVSELRVLIVVWSRPQCQPYINISTIREVTPKTSRCSVGCNSENVLFQRGFKLLGDYAPPSPFPFFWWAGGK